MKASGVSTRVRMRRAVSSILSVVAPPRSARTFAAWMTGPSAVGSEKGMPSSMRSAPASAIAQASSSVTARLGSPQVMNGIKALPFSKARLMLLMQILSSVPRYSRAVLVAASRETDDDYFVFSHLRRDLHRVRDGVRALYRGDYALRAREILEGLD